MAGVTEITGFAHLDDLPCYLLSFGEATAVVSRYGGQILSYQPKPGLELLWVSPLAVWQQQQPIRGGIPVCWPWFGPADQALNPQQQALPNHGLVRNRLWRLQKHHSNESSCSLTLDITLTDFPALPQSVLTAVASGLTLQLTLSLMADSLSIHLSCPQPVLQQAALHSYFRVNDLASTKVTGIGAEYDDKVRQNQRVTADHGLAFNQEIDRIYRQPAAQLGIISGSQQLAIHQQGFDSTIVWNPGVERCKAIADLADNSYQQFVCVETARLSLSEATALCLTQRISLG